MPNRLGSNGRRGRLDWKLARSGSVVVIGGREPERASGITALTVETCSCWRCVCGPFVMLIPSRALGVRAPVPLQLGSRGATRRGRRCVCRWGRCGRRGWGAGRGGGFPRAVERAGWAQCALSDAVDQARSLVGRPAGSRLRARWSGHLWGGAGGRWPVRSRNSKPAK